ALRVAPGSCARCGASRRSLATSCARRWWGWRPTESVVGQEDRMLRIYEVAIEMVGGAAGVADAIERRDADLARQMRRAAASVALNVAEGAGNTAGHKRQRYQTALGSAREVMACIDVAKAMRYIDRVDDALVDQVDHVIATMVRLVRH